MLRDASLRKGCQGSSASGMGKEGGWERFGMMKVGREKEAEGKLRGGDVIRKFSISRALPSKCSFGKSPYRWYRSN